VASVIKKGRDEEVRDLFRRLQRGKPLTEGEKLNAMPGNIVRLMRELTNHDFFKKSLTSKDKRHKCYHVAALFLYVERGIADTNFKNIEKFFKEREDMRKDDKIFRKVSGNLNFLSKVYTDNELPSSNLGWLTSVYLFISDIKTYGLLGTCSYQDIHDYLESFYSIVYCEYERKADYKDFYDMIHASTNKKSHVMDRHLILKKYFLDAFKVHKKSEKRLFSSTQDRKIIYTKANGRCQYSGCDKSTKNIKFKDKFEIHHAKMYASGCRHSHKDAMIVHPECHRAIHRNSRLKRIKIY